jgi:hypothetical protein
MADPRRPLSFLELDYDIRLQIYGELLIRPDSTPLEFHQKPIRLWTDNALLQTFQPQILRTCKQIYNEAMPLLYGQNEFKFRVDTGSIDPRASEFVFCVSARRAKLIRRIILVKEWPLYGVHKDFDLKAPVLAELEQLAQSMNVRHLKLGVPENDADVYQPWLAPLREIFFPRKEIQERITTLAPRPPGIYTAARPFNLLTFSSPPDNTTVFEMMDTSTHASRDQRLRQGSQTN